MIDIVFVIAYALLGLIAGVLAGLLGVGGGLVIVPTLIWLFTLQAFDYSVIAHAAVGSSLATIIATAVSSAVAHHRHGAVNWVSVKQLSMGLFVGAFAGAWLADQMDTALLQLVFGIFAILVSLQLFFRAQAISKKPLPGFAGMNIAGLLIGTVSGVVGIGGGSMTVPFLTWHNVNIRQAVATSSACGLPIAVAGFIGFMLVGWSTVKMPAYSTGFIYWPAVIVVSIFSVFLAPFGARLAHRLPVARLKQVFALLLMVIGMKLAGVY